MKTTRRGFLGAGMTAALAASVKPAMAAAPKGKKFFRGQFHAHTYWSDGSAFPEQAVRHYSERGYHFLGISDHNIYQTGRKVKKFQKKSSSQMAILEEYRKTWPRNFECKEGENGDLEVLVQPLSKMREMFEKPGEFILLDAVEATTSITYDDGVNNQVHMNYLNVPKMIEMPRKTVSEGGVVRKVTVAERIRDTHKLVSDLAKEMGRDEMFILNHPVWRWYDVTPEDLIANPEVRFFELCNGGSPYKNAKGLPSDGWATDRFWDIVNAFRARRGEKLLYGVGTDDTHTYFNTAGSVPGIHCLAFNSWCYVRAEELTQDALVKAMKAADFAVCEGFEPKDFSFDASTGTLSVSVDGKKNVCRTIEFIVTKKDFSEKPVKTIEVFPEDAPEKNRKICRRKINVYDHKKIGCVAKKVSGGIGEDVSASYTMKDDDLYVRARIVSPERPAASAYQHPKVHVVWTQPYPKG
jgi:hypothetical protein